MYLLTKLEGRTGKCLAGGQNAVRADREPTMLKLCAKLR